MLLVSILFPFVKPFGASWPGKPFFVRSSTADKWEDKTSVRREGADGIPKIPRHAEICGRLPSSPPAESAGGIVVPPVHSTFARENAFRT